MAIIEWNESLALNIPRIDEQHHRLVTMMGELETSVKEGTGGLYINYVLEELIRYITGHFEDEEQLMMRHNFPGLGSHRQEHDSYVTRLKDIKGSFRDGDVLSRHTLDFLEEWIVNHIKGTDQIYGSFIRAEAVETKID
jgi:hemerythrin